MVMAMLGKMAGKNETLEQKQTERTETLRRHPATCPDTVALFSESRAENAESAEKSAPRPAHSHCQILLARRARRGYPDTCSPAGG
jgi:hypothetical protein